MKNIRVRFAPSPTGPLHIGGLRTALYNYLLTRKHGGTFILRSEDTDQTRYVAGAEDHIVNSLKWCGLIPDEGPSFGGNYGPYRQSERKALYQKYVQQLVDSGHAYYAFDTPEELEAQRQEEKAKGNHTFKYDATMRQQMNNSTRLSADELKALLDNKTPYTIRLKVPENESVVVKDLIRGEVVFQTNELDDKILLKTDGMPTYHLANIVDDYSMKITHVIRGEEWLPSTAHHLLLYRAFGWEDNIPQFAHLPLILKPKGKGKLGKRDGAKFGFPVFPLTWEDPSSKDIFTGFKSFGFDPKAVLNFIAFLGWNPGTEQEIFSMDELIQAFSIEKVSKGGARFNFDKAKWFNQQYIMATPNKELAKKLRPSIEEKNYEVSDEFLTTFCGLFKERVTFLSDFYDMGYYFFEGVKDYEEKMIKKRWKSENQTKFEDLLNILDNTSPFTASLIESNLKQFINESGLKFGEVFPILRIALSGTTKGPDLYAMMALLGKKVVRERVEKAFEVFNGIKAGV